MGIVEILHVVLAIIGLLIRWLLHLQRAQTRAKERVRKALLPLEKDREKFSWDTYFSENWILMSVSLLSTIALLFITPMVLELLGVAMERTSNLEVIGNLAAFAGGLLNLELVYALKRRIVDKIRYKPKSR